MIIKSDKINWTGLGEAFDAAITRKGWSKKLLAEKLGVTPSAITFLVNGEAHRLSRPVVTKACELLSINSADFEPETDERAFCPNILCARGFALIRNDTPIWYPFFFSVRLLCCTECGTKLIRGCPECDAPISRTGPCCTHCGAAFVPIGQSNPLEESSDRKEKPSTDNDNQPPEITFSPKRFQQLPIDFFGGNIKEYAAHLNFWKSLDCNSL